MLHLIESDDAKDAALETEMEDCDSLDSGPVQENITTDRQRRNGQTHPSGQLVLLTYALCHQYPAVSFRPSSAHHTVASSSTACLCCRWCLLHRTHLVRVM